MAFSHCSESMSLSRITKHQHVGLVILVILALVMSKIICLGKPLISFLI